MSSTDPREQVLSRFSVDLIGPREPEETIVSRPSDVYLTGILWPRNTALAPEEDEHLSVAQGGKEEGEDAADQAQAQAVPMKRPSTAGLSFAASSDGTPRIRVAVRFATYEPIPAGKKKHWVRRQHEPDPFVIELAPGISRIRRV